MDATVYELPPAVVAQAPAPEERPSPYRLIEPPRDHSVRDREIAFQVLNLVDLAETLYCVHGIPERCHEANPIYGKRPSVGKIIALKAADGAVHYGVTKLLQRHKPNLVKPWQITTIVFYGGLVTWNATVIF